MRILFLCNFYPPYASGGQEISCQQVVEALRQRGYATLVLTSMHGTNNVPVEADGIYRSLYLEMDLVPWRHSLTFFSKRKAREQHNLHYFERVLEQFEPDIIFIWGMWNLPRSLPALAEARYPDKVIYRFATYWPTLPSQHEFYWRKLGRKWYSQLPKRVLGHVALTMLATEDQRPPLSFRHAICVSAATRNILVEAGIPIANARIIHTGLDAELYLNGQPNHQPSHNNQNLNLLYGGRLYPEKGVDTIIEALAKLVFDRGLRNVSLSLAGSGSADYENYLRHLVTQTGLNDYVTFFGHVPAEELPQLLRKFDVLLVPSTWPEPFARMLLEGMVSALVVVATPTGGTTEILTDGENGLLFAPGDAEDLAQKIAHLAADPELRRRLALAGQRTVLERFTMTKMMDEIESYLHEVAHISTKNKTTQFERKEEGTIMEFLPTVSVIIPTYNRKDSLHDTLNSLARQTYPSDRFEVIVVDDGSTDGTKEIAAEAFPFTLRYFCQSNQGAAAARNLAARQSRADILVLLDDDMLVEPDYLTYLIHEHAMCQNRIVVGVVTIRPEETTLLSQTLDTVLASNQSSVEMAFTDVYSNNMSLRREAYFEVGMMQDLNFLGASIWCDVDFAYRAYRQGFEFRRCTKAKCWHRDHVVRSLDHYSKRVRTAAYRAVVLFQKYPELPPHLPMFYDKTPIIWGQDSPRLIARKLARSMASSRPALWSMEQIVNALEKRYPVSTLLPSLYRYIIGGYIFQGYREGLRQFGQVDHRDEPVLLT